VLVPSGIQEHGPLFEAVQLLRVFPDGKTFVDAELRLSAAEISAAFSTLQRTHSQPDQLRDALRSHLPEWFTFRCERRPPMRTSKPRGQG
jgi:hypothetical protein